METKKVGDLVCVAYLVSVGFKYVADPEWILNRWHFVFEKTPELEQAVESFFNNEVTINPVVFESHLRRLRSYVRDLMQSREVKYEK